VLYEQGIALSGSIQKTLEAAEQHVTQVSANGSLMEEEGPPGEA
jgi:exonuclease VII small subunit